MECSKTSHIQILLLLLLLIFGLSKAAIPYAGNGNETENEKENGVSSVEFEGGATVFSTWESASTHRILQQTQRLNVYSVTNKSPACNSRQYSNCVATASGKTARPCNTYNRCSRNTQ